MCTVSSTIMYVYNRSTVVQDTEVVSMVAAANILIKRVCKEWSRLPVTIQFLTYVEPSADYVYYILDTDLAMPQRTSYHTVAYGKVTGYIFAKTILENGGVVLYQDNSTYTVASAVFQEIAQSLINPYANTWWQMNATTLAYGQITDPVHFNIVVQPITISGIKINIGLSDFVYPSWYNVQASSTSQFNYKKTLNQPFSIAGCGFIITVDINTGIFNNIFGKNITSVQRSIINKCTTCK
jgi:hypothetical protein